MHFPALFSFIVFSVVTTFSLPLLAQSSWDRQAFVDLGQKAQKAYEAKDFETALTHYEKLGQMLEDGFENTTIAPDFVASAEQARALLQYNLGRTLTQLTQCEKALTHLDAYMADPKFNAASAPKVTLRKAEAHLCLAEQAAAQNDPNNEQAALDLARTLIDSADTKKKKDIALRDSLQQQLDDWKANRRNALVSEAQAALDEGRCSDAHTALDGLPEDHSPELRDTYLAQCDESVDWLAIAPWIVAGTGGVLLLTAVILEGANAGEIDLYEEARDQCLDGNGQLCPEALTRADEIQSQRNTTIGLITVGGLLVAGGVAWWAFTNYGESEDSVAIVPSVGPSHAHVQVRMSW